MTPELYIARIRPLRDPAEIEAVCRELAESLFGDQDLASKTRANKLTPYNKLINKIPNEELVEGENAFIYTKEDGTLWKRHLHHKFLGLTKEEWRKINSKTIVLDRLENRRKVDVARYLEVTIKLLQSSDPHELAVGLVAASGRRPVEILARGSFTLTKELPEYLKHGYFVNFKGQAKKRDYDMPIDERVEYRIGVLVHTDLFLQAFTRFRKMPEVKELLTYMKTETKKGLSPEEINDAIESRRGNSLRRIVRREFGSFLPARFGEEEIDNKTLRAVYTRLIVERDCPKSIDGLLWASRAVGHFIDQEKPNDSQLRHLVTTLGYSDYYCDTEVPFIEAPTPEQKEKLVTIRAFDSDVGVIRELQDKWTLPNQQSVIRYLIDKSSQIETLERQLVEKDAKYQQLTQENNQLKQELVKMQEQLQQTEAQVKATNETHSEVQATTQETELQPQQQDLESMIQQIVAKELHKALSQVQFLQPQQLQPVVEKQQQSVSPAKVKVEKQQRDWSSVPSEQLKQSKASGASDERLLRSLRAICDYNDHVATSSDQRWAINNVTLRSLSGCNPGIVADWMERFKISIDDHNGKYGLGQYHNKKHKNTKVNDIIKW